MEPKDFYAPIPPYSGPTNDVADHILNDHLQNFANEVSIITGLESGGKMTPQEAYRRIKAAWKLIKKTKKSLSNQE